MLCELLGARQGRESELQRQACDLNAQLCDGDGDEGNGDGGGGGDGGDDDGGGDAEARCSAAETAGLIAAVCALRDAIGPVRKAATYALRAICSSDASRWREAKLAGAPAAWRPKK